MPRSATRRQMRFSMFQSSSASCARSAPQLSHNSIFERSLRSCQMGGRDRCNDIPPSKTARCLCKVIIKLKALQPNLTQSNLALLKHGHTACNRGSACKGAFACKNALGRTWAHLHAKTHLDALGRICMQRSCSVRRNSMERENFR